MRDVLDDMASELQVQAGTLDLSDDTAVLAWSRACADVLRAMSDHEARDSHLVSFAIVLVLRARELGQHDLSCREVKELLSRMMTGEIA